MKERIIPFFFLFGSLLYLYWAQDFAIGTLNSPKSGFLPTLSGLIALSLSLLIIFLQPRIKKASNQNTIDWTRFLFLIMGLLFYIMILNIVGYFMATFIFLSYLFKIADTAGWRFPLTISFCSSALFYLLFIHYLKVTLP